MLISTTRLVSLKVYNYTPLEMKEILGKPAFIVVALLLLILCTSEARPVHASQFSGGDSLHPRNADGELQGSQPTS